MKCRPVCAEEWNRRIIASVLKRNILQEKKEVFSSKTSVEYLKAGILCRWQERKSSHGDLAYFLEGMLKLTGVAEVNRNIRCLTVAMESLDDIQVENLQKAGKLLEIPENSFIIMDHEESFYYYIMGQKAETWNRSVGWYNFDNNHVTFRKMVMSSGAKPVMVKLEDPIETDLNEAMMSREMPTFIPLPKTHLEMSCIPAFR